VNKNLRFLVVLVVAVNVVVVGWLLLRKPPQQGAQDVGDVLTPLVSDETMAAARYDLSDRADELNVILISMDALRWDRTGLSGNKDGLTPNLDRFGQEAAVFTKTVSAAPWTLPSHMSVWTARWPSIHQVTNKLRPLSGGQMVETSLSPGVQTYPDLLMAGGRVAAGFTGGAGVQGKYGFSRGFDAYLDDRPFAGMEYSEPAALQWLQAHQDQPFFLFLHGYDCHGQYPLPESQLRSINDYGGSLNGSIEEQAELREAGLEKIVNPGDDPDLSDRLDAADAQFLEDIYDLKVKAADERVGSFLRELERMDLLDSSIVVIMSDHGDEFMDHGGLDHGATLYEEQIHTVMMMRFPGFARQKLVDVPVRSVDLFPTVFDALGLQGPTGVDGKSLLPLLRDERNTASPGPLVSETDYRLFVHQRMLRQDDHKLILDLLDGERELYDLATDPGEHTDSSSSDARRTYEMEQGLRTWMEQTNVNPQDYLGLDETPISIF